MSIEVSHLTHCYSEGSALRTVALNDVSFRIEDGEFIGIIGHTGSGKSTLVQHLNGLLKPSSGQILIDGEDLNGEHVNRRALRQRIGLVFQYPEYQLFEETVFKDICYGLKKMGIEKAEMHKMAHDAAIMVGLSNDEVNSSPFELSGGQKRRAAMAGVLAMKPGILVLDEPASGLDPVGRHEMFKIIKELRNSGTTIVLVSHNMDEAAVNCDRICLIDNGKIKAVGTPAELFVKKTADELKVQLPRITRFSAVLRTELEEIYPDIEFCGNCFVPEKEAKVIVDAVYRAGGADVK